MNFVLPIDRKFLCQHRNGDDFLTLPATDFVPYVQGEIIEKLKVIAQYEVSTITEASPSSQILAETVGAQVKITHPFNDWSSEGFVVGNSIRIEVGPLSVDQTVENIVGTDMYVTSTLFFSTLGTTDGDARPDYILKVLTQPTSLIFQFGIIPNADVANTYGSLLDGQEQAYSVDGIAGALTALDYLATTSSNLGSVETKFDSVSDAYKFTFTVEHIFRVPHFIAEWLTNYENGTNPFLFQGSNSYRYVSRLNFGVNSNNPNDGKIFTDDYQDGSIGFRGQNFNTGVSDYILNVPTTFSISGDEAQAPEATLSTIVTAQIKRLSGAFTAGVKGYLYHSKLPQEFEYSNNDDAYESNFVIDQLFNVDGGGAKSSVIISSMTTTINGGDPSLLDVVFTLTYPAAQLAKINAGDVLFLGLIVENGALSATLSDRALVEFDVVSWSKGSDISGLITNFQGDITEYGSTVSKSNINNWINQTYVLDFTFDMKKEVNSSDASLVRLALQQVGFNTITNEVFISTPFNLPIGKISTVDVDGTDYQQINLATERFLSVPSGQALREIKLDSVVPSAFAATQNFTGKVGFILDWQEWIQNTNVPSIFYDGALPAEFFNLNKRLSNYSGINGFDIFIFLVADVLHSGVITKYAMISDKCLIADFDVDPAAVPWTAVTKLFDNDGDETDDIYNEDIRIEIKFTSPTAGGLILGDVMGEIVFEETLNNGRHFRLHTAFDFSEAVNPLIPLAGETRVKMTQGAGDITLECLIKGDTLDPAKKYNIYGHLKDNR